MLGRKGERTILYHDAAARSSRRQLRRADASPQAPGDDRFPDCEGLDPTRPVVAATFNDACRSLRECGLPALGGADRLAHGEHWDASEIVMSAEN